MRQLPLPPHDALQVRDAGRGAHAAAGVCRRPHQGRHALGHLRQLEGAHPRLLHRPVQRGHVHVPQPGELRDVPGHLLGHGCLGLGPLPRLRQPARWPWLLGRPRLPDRLRRRNQLGPLAVGGGAELLRTGQGRCPPLDARRVALPGWLRLLLLDTGGHAHPLGSPWRRECHRRSCAHVAPRRPVAQRMAQVRRPPSQGCLTLCWWVEGGGVVRRGAIFALDFVAAVKKT
mmetsp:Transcript_5183/g.13843  ORF Transcript_5183/g.13843 Transcript_5183/m.13843 type:complete len:230 (+) Transcript_5183:261-950(+)